MQERDEGLAVLFFQPLGPAMGRVIELIRRFHRHDDIALMKSCGFGPTAGLDIDDNQSQVKLKAELGGDLGIEFAQLQAPRFHGRGH
jgi:hypothetical protein